MELEANTISNDDDINQIVADRLKELRRNRGMKQQECSRRIGLALGAWSNYESRIRNISLDKLVTICQTFNVSMEYMLGLSDSEKGDSKHYAISKNSAVAINKDELRDREIRAQNLIEIKAADDAMQPSIKKGDVVIINTGNKKYSNAVNLFAINHPRLGTIIRGIRPELNGTYTLFVSNRGEHDDLTVTEAELNNIDIVGSYIGHWQWSKN